jgi:hypothetical protein
VYLLCTYVGPVHLVYFSRTRQCPQPEAGLAIVVGLATVAGGPPAGDVERVLRPAERNLIVLTHVVPMEEIKDLSPVMQSHVVGVPRT